VLAREVGQRPGLRERHVGARACVAQRLGHHPAAERAGRQEHDLPISKMRRHGASNIVLRRRRRRDHDQLGAADCLSDFGSDRNVYIARTANVDQPDGALERGCVAAPETHLVPLLGKVRRGGIGAVAAAEHRDLHRLRAWNTQAALPVAAQEVSPAVASAPSASEATACNIPAIGAQTGCSDLPQPCANGLFCTVSTIDLPSCANAQLPHPSCDAFTATLASRSCGFCA